MFLLSSTDLAIFLATEDDTLRVVGRSSRFGGISYAIEDDAGIIEVAATQAEAAARIASARAQWVPAR